MSSRINIEWGHGYTDAVIDLAKGEIIMAMGDRLNVRGYASDTGLTGDGWIPAHPAVRKINSYRTDIRTSQMFPREQHGINEVEGFQIFAPYHHGGHNESPFLRDEEWDFGDFPVIVRKDDRVWLMDGCILVSFLKGDLNFEDKYEFNYSYIKAPGHEKVSRKLIFSGTRKFEDAFRALRGLIWEESSFNWAEDWPESSDFWKNLNLHKNGDKLYKVAGGICYDVYEEDELVGNIDKFKEVVPKDVQMITPDLYVQGSEKPELVGLFDFEGEEFSFATKLNFTQLLKVLSGETQEILELLEQDAREAWEKIQKRRGTALEARISGNFPEKGLAVPSNLSKMGAFTMPDDA